MVGKKRRKPSKELMGSHQKCWLWGRHAVMETLRAKKWTPVEVFWCSEYLDLSQQRELKNLVHHQRIPCAEATPAEMQKFCGSTEHQGLLAKMPVYPYASAEEVFPRLDSRQVILVLCGIQDPFNFGSILRSADLFGISTIVVPSSAQASVSSHVVRSSVGAVNFLDIVQVDDLGETCRVLKDRGFRLLAGSEQGKTAPFEADLTLGLALLIGNEGAGVPGHLLHLCDQQIAIPQSGHVGSLNAAVAAGILCYEIQRQRQLAGAG